MSRFAKRDHLGRTSDFELGIWHESTSDELPFALYCAALVRSSFETQERATGFTLGQKVGDTSQVIMRQ